MVVADTMTGSPNLGHVYVGYDDAGANNAAFVMKSNDGFANWTRSPKINDAGTTIGNNIATLPNGAITAVWEDYPGKQIRVDTSANGGSTWGTDHVVTNYRLATGSFFICIPPQPQRCVVPMPFSDADLTGNHAGRLYVTYPDKSPTAADWNVYVRYSDDAGATWSPEIQVNDDAGGAYQFFPAISVAGDGTVAISWYDTQERPDQQEDRPVLGLLEGRRRHVEHQREDHLRDVGRVGRGRRERLRRLRGDGRVPRPSTGAVRRGVDGLPAGHDRRGHVRSPGSVELGKQHHVRRAGRMPARPSAAAP